jgi:putative ABC transport system substrate-binding protein
VRRRELVLACGSLIAAIPAMPGWAQETGRIYRIGSLFAAPRDAPHHLALFAELRRAGFVEGQNLSVDWAGYGLRVEQFGVHAAELVRDGVDLIEAGGDGAVRAAQQATAEIPILALADDMVGQGFVRSLAKPSGNTTGVTILASQLDGKRQAMLIEALPGIRHLAALADSTITTDAPLQGLREAARSQGVELAVYSVGRPEDIPAALEAARASGAQALNVLASALFYNNRPILFEGVAALRLPTMYQWPEMARQGGFIGYGPSILQLYRDVQSRQLLSLLRGAKPADLPVEQPTKFELVINLKTAKMLGVTVPPILLAQADEFIE